MYSLCVWGSEWISRVLPMFWELDGFFLPMFSTFVKGVLQSRGLWKWDPGHERKWSQLGGVYLSKSWVTIAMFAKEKVPTFVDFTFCIRVGFMFEIFWGLASFSIFEFGGDFWKVVLNYLGKLPYDPKTSLPFDYLCNLTSKFGFWFTNGKVF